MAFENIFLEGLPMYDGGKIEEAVSLGGGLYDDRPTLDTYNTIFKIGDKYSEEDFKQKILDMKEQTELIWRHQKKVFPQESATK